MSCQLHVAQGLKMDYEKATEAPPEAGLTRSPPMWTTLIEPHLMASSVMGTWIIREPKPLVEATSGQARIGD